MPEDLNPTVQHIMKLFGPPRDSDGAYVVACPWAGEHTSGKSATEAVYWPPNEKNGYRGWFKCMHSHCIDSRYANHFHAVMEVGTRLELRDAEALIVTKQPPPIEDIGARLRAIATSPQFTTQAPPGLGGPSRSPASWPRRSRP